jgi:hypothetical protein
LAGGDQPGPDRRGALRQTAQLPGQSDFPDLWTGVDPSLDIEDPSLSRLVQYWEAKRGGRVMPSRADLDPVELKEHLANLCLIDVEHDPLRMRYRLVGTAITRVMNRDATGFYYHDLYPPKVVAASTRCFAWICEHRAPLRIAGRVTYPDANFYRYEVVELPLSKDGETVDMVLGKLVFKPVRP